LTTWKSNSNNFSSKTKGEGEEEKKIGLDEALIPRRNAIDIYI
jgi:hypothetical protein